MTTAGRKFTIAVSLAAAILSPAWSRDNGQWGDQPAEIRQWFQSVMQPGTREISCCGAGDAFDVELDGEQDGDIRAIILNGRGVIPDGTLVVVPRDKLQTKYGNPLDKIILFINTAGKPLCLIPKAGV